jgi:hypothetical protein
MRCALTRLASWPAGRRLQAAAGGCRRLQAAAGGCSARWACLPGAPAPLRPAPCRPAVARAVQLASEEALLYAAPEPEPAVRAALGALEGLQALLARAGRWRRLRDVAWRRTLMEQAGGGAEGSSEGPPAAAGGWLPGCVAWSWAGGGLGPLRRG